MSPRLALTYIKYLPIESAFVAERRGGQQFRGWDEGRYAQVATVNALRGIQHSYLEVHGTKKPKAPEPYPVPDQQKRPQRGEGAFSRQARSQIAETRRRREERGS